MNENRNELENEINELMMNHIEILTEEIDCGIELVRRAIINYMYQDCDYSLFVKKLVALQMVREKLNKL